MTQPVEPMQLVQRHDFPQDFQNSQVFGDVNFKSGERPYARSSDSEVSFLEGEVISDKQQLITPICLDPLKQRLLATYDIPPRRIRKVDNPEEFEKGENLNNLGECIDNSLKQNELSEMNTVPRRQSSNERLNISPTEPKETTSCSIWNQSNPECTKSEGAIKKSKKNSPDLGFKSEQSLMNGELSDLSTVQRNVEALTPKLLKKCEKNIKEGETGEMDLLDEILKEVCDNNDFHLSRQGFQSMDNHETPAQRAGHAADTPPAIPRRPSSVSVNSVQSNGKDTRGSGSSNAVEPQQEKTVIDPTKPLQYVDLKKYDGNNDSEEAGMLVIHGAGSIFLSSKNKRRYENIPGEPKEGQQPKENNSNPYGTKKLNYIEVVHVDAGIDYEKVLGEHGDIVVGERKDRSKLPVREKVSYASIQIPPVPPAPCPGALDNDRSKMKYENVPNSYCNLPEGEHGRPVHHDPDGIYLEMGRPEPGK